MNRLIYPQFDEIAYLEADINYTIFHLNDGKKMVSSTTLKRHAQTENLKSFLRISKSFLLNPEFISNYEQDGKRVLIVLQNGRKVLVSRRKIGIVRSQLLDFHLN